MVPVAGDAERAAADHRDVVRLGRVRDALPVRRDALVQAVLVRGRRVLVDVIEVVVLHRHDDDLVEANGCARGHATGRPIRGDVNEEKGRDGEGQEGDEQTRDENSRRS